MAGTVPPRRLVQLPFALKFPDFRSYWVGLLVSVTGYQMLVLFSLGWLMSHELTGDVRYLGYMTTALAVPGIGLNLIGGMLADKVDAKRLLGLTQFTMGLVVGILALLTALEIVEVWHVVGAAFLIGIAQAFDNPIRQAIFPRLIAREALSSAVALNSAVWTGTRIYAPFIAGIIIGRADIGPALFVSTAGFVVLGLVSQTLKVLPPQTSGEGVRREMAMGFQFIVKDPIFFILIGMTFALAAFGMSYVFLMPVFADDVLKVGAEKIGYLMGAAGVGALIGIAIGASLARSRRKGWWLLVGGTTFGVFLILFAVVSDLELYVPAMAVLFIGDMALSIYLMLVLTTLQGMVPDGLRGRVMGIFTITWSLVPLGALVSSQIAHYQGPPVAVGVGGGLVVASALGVALFTRHVRDLGRTEVGSTRSS